MAINWRERAIAATIHFGVTLLMAGIAAAVIFLVWYPGTLAGLVGGTKLFLLILASDLVLGPLMSLIIYSSKKARRTLIIDYTVIGAVQLGMLLYGVSVVADSRPTFIAFEVDRLEVVAAAELETADLAAGSEAAFQTNSWLGPRLVSVALPTDAKAKFELLISAIARKDGHLLPKYYRSYAAAREQILFRSQPIEDLLKNNSDMQSNIAAAVEATGKPAKALRWLLVHHRFGFGTALIDAQSAEPLRYIAIDPTALIVR